MAQVAETVSVTTTAGVLVSASAATMESPVAGYFEVPSGGSTVYIGGEGVDTTDGMPVEGGERRNFALLPGDNLYAVVASGTQDVNVIRRRKGTA